MRIRSSGSQKLTHQIQTASVPEWRQTELSQKIDSTFLDFCPTPKKADTALCQQNGRFLAIGSHEFG